MTLSFDTFRFSQVLVTGNVKFGNLGRPVGVDMQFGWVLNGPLKGKDVNSYVFFHHIRLKL